MSNTKIKNLIASKTGLTLDQMMAKFGGNKSAVMRYLAAQPGSEFATARIADFMGVRYQHVRNVLSMPLKKEVVTELPKEEEESTVTVLTGQEAKDKLAKRPAK